MRRFVFQPRWILGHLLVIAAAFTCVWLSGWQWDRASLTGAVQNWGYAFQWPLFAVCFLIGWWRLLRLEARRLCDADKHDPDEQDGAEDTVDTPLLAPPTDARPDAATSASTPAIGSVDGRADEDDDEYFAAYNRMLATLAAQDAARDAAQNAARDAGRRR